MAQLLHLAFFVLLATVLAVPTGQHQPSLLSTVVDLGYAQYKGTRQSDGITSWLGMRYAAPPLGNLRWRAPTNPAVNRSTVQPAQDFGAICIGMQGASAPLSASVNEDCLFINVWSPANATAESKLPVWFFIMGGGYAEDGDHNFNGTNLLESSDQSIVFVQINYRVGAFGFLASEGVREDGDLNVGILDQRFAMHWVQENIHLFGGDPDHVVIGGDSAGAGSISHHLTAFSGRDDKLFIGAMMESPFWPTQRTVPQMEFQFDFFTKSLNCSKTDGRATMECLRSKSSAELQKFDVDQIYPGAPAKGDWTWLPVVDNGICIGSLYDAFDCGRFVRVPVLVGDDTNEGTLFVRNTTDVADFKRNLRDYYPLLSEQNLDVIAEAYPEDSFPPFPNRRRYFSATAQAYGEATFICPGIEIAKSIAEYEGQGKSWNYRYNIAVKKFVEEGLGVYHTSDDPAIFGPNYSKSCSICKVEPNEVKAALMDQHYWLSFVRSLDPNTHRYPGSPVWDSLEPHSPVPRRMTIQPDATQMEAIPDAQLKRCALWKSLDRVTEQ